MVAKTEGSKRWMYIWDNENRLAQAWDRKSRVRYLYDALGRRVQRSLVGGRENTKFIYDGQDVLVDDNSGTLTKYLNGAGIDNKLRMQIGTDVKFFIADHLGSTNGLTDASGNLIEQTSYDSFVNATNNLSTRYQFTGREFDSFTGLHYYRARWYDGNLGRFISEDPIGFEGGDVNLFAYVGNNPINKIDPFGETEEGMIDRLQYHQDPGTREYVAKWDSCLSKCLLNYLAGGIAGFGGFVFGQPMNPKRFVTPGSSEGTSPISEGLSKRFPQKLPYKVPAPTWKRPFATSRHVGRVAGRWIPFIGTGMMIADFFAILSCANECYDGECNE